MAGDFICSKLMTFCPHHFPRVVKRIKNLELLATEARDLIAGNTPTGGYFQNPRSRNLGPQNKRPGSFSGEKDPGTLILRRQIP